MSKRRGIMYSVAENPTPFVLGEVPYIPIDRGFLRIHSKNDLRDDVQTQVWACAFAPFDSAIVATCGGSSICITDVTRNEVIAKYNSEDLSEIFYDLVWAKCCNDTVDVLVAAGGSSGKKRQLTLLFLDRGSSSVLTESISSNGKSVINALMVHPKYRDIIFCGWSDGTIAVYKIHGSESEPFEYLNSFNLNCEVFQMAFSVKTNMFLAATDDGLKICKINNDTFAIDAKINVKKMNIPYAPGIPDENRGSLFDSVIILDQEETIIATKRALEGHILLWNLDSAINNKFKVQQGQFLKWSDTDNYYMGLSWNNDEKILACGDDKGNMWIYNLNRVLINGINNDLFPMRPNSVIKHDYILGWPSNHIIDTYLDRSRKLNVNVYDIVISRIAFSGPYIVAVTNNNMVCIWKKLDE